jgi:hypothetical protein
MKFRLLYNPRMYVNAVQSGSLRWPGTYLFGGGFIKSGFNTLSNIMPGQGQGRAGGVVRGIGSFFGGQAGPGSQLFDPANRVLTQGPGLYGNQIYSIGGLDKAFRSGKMFTPGGFRTTALEIDRGNYGQIRQILRDENIAYRGLGDEPRAWRRMGPAQVRYGPGGVAMAAETSEVMEKNTVQAFLRDRIGKKSGARQVASYAALRTMGVVSTLATAGLVFELGALAGYGAVVGAQAIQSKLSTFNGLDFGTGQFRAAQTAGAATERQRALQSIQQHHLNARRMIGNEAALMHS